MSIICDNCGQGLTDDAAVCNMCGKSLLPTGAGKKSKKRSTVVCAALLGLLIVILLGFVFVLKEMPKPLVENNPPPEDIPEAFGNDFLYIARIPKGVVITKYTGEYSGFTDRVRIPEQLGMPVVAIDGVNQDGGPFQNSDITYVYIPNSVTYIGEDAFRDCQGLSSVTIPDNVSSIGNSAFDGIPNFTAIYKGEHYSSIEGDDRYFRMPEEFYNAINF